MQAILTACITDLRSCRAVAEALKRTAHAPDAIYLLYPIWYRVYTELMAEQRRRLIGDYGYEPLPPGSVMVAGIKIRIKLKENKK